MFIKSKQILRTLYKTVRNGIDASTRTDCNSRMFTMLINSEIYSKSELILIYVSFGSEADTRNIINHSLCIGKRVAVPFCSGNEMTFYEINDLNELIIGKFGIPTVNTGYNLPVDDFKNSLCVVPGVCFDLYGNRVGYGGGFYDRFLEENKIATVALSYERCIVEQIPYEPHDIRIDYVITENYIRETLCKEASTYE